MMRRRRINEGKTVQLRVLVTIFLYFMAALTVTFSRGVIQHQQVLHPLIDNMV